MLIDVESFKQLFMFSSFPLPDEVFRLLRAVRKDFFFAYGANSFEIESRTFTDLMHARM